MSLIKASVDGNWSDGGTWIGGDLPGQFDTADLNGHEVVIDQRMYISSNLVGPAAVIDSVGGGSLTLADNQEIASATDFTAVTLILGNGAGGCVLSDDDNNFGVVTIPPAMGLNTISGGTIGTVNDNGSGGNQYTGGTIGEINDQASGNNTYTSTVLASVQKLTVGSNVLSTGGGSGGGGVSIPISARQGISLPGEVIVSSD